MAFKIRRFSLRYKNTFAFANIGMLLFAFSTTGFIVFLVLSESPDCKHQDIAILLNDTIEIIILLVMIAVCVWVR